MEDPTRKNLRDCLKKSPHYSEADVIDIECAIFWLASNYHSGQGSHLYSVLSLSPYKPGASECGPEKDSIADFLYQDLKEEFMK